MLLSSTFSSSSFMSSTAVSKTVTHSAMGCPGRLWSFLKKNSWTCRFFVASSILMAFTPAISLCLHPSSVEFGQARWSQHTSELSLSNGKAIEHRERSPRQASPFRDRARHLATLGLGPMSVCLHSCLLRCLCWHGDQLLLASAIHESTSLSTQSQSTLSPELGGSAAGLSDFGDSDSQFLSSATQEDLQSSAALACNS